jgi:hypothetical protein
MRRTLYIEFVNGYEESFTYRFGANCATVTVAGRHTANIQPLINQLNITIPHDDWKVNDDMYSAYAEALSRHVRGVVNNTPQSPITDAELAVAVRRVNGVSNVELEYLMTRYHAAANKPAVDPTPQGRKRMANFVNNITRGQYSREQVDEIVEKIVKDVYNRSITITAD